MALFSLTLTHDLLSYSNAREWMEEYLLRRGPSDGALDQIANRWGRRGGDPNKYRPNGLPSEY